MKKPIKPSGILVSVGILAAFAVAAGMFVWPYMPQTIKDVVAPTPATGTNAQEDTVTTRPSLSMKHLYTEPSEWFAVGDEVEWNDQAVFCVEDVKISRSLPDDIADMEPCSSNRTPAWYQGLNDKYGVFLFMEMTVSVSCTALLPETLYGTTIEKDYLRFSGGVMDPWYYDRDTASAAEFDWFDEHYPDAEPTPGYYNKNVVHSYFYPSMVAIEDLSGNFGGSMYALAVGESARFRVLYFLPQVCWENVDLLTTFYGHNAETSTLLGYSQPQVLLNPKDES